MRRGTTPTLELTLDASLTDCEYRVTLANGKKKITKSESDCTLSEDGKVIRLLLSQEETLSLDPNHPVRVQVRFKVNDLAYATNIVQTSVEDILLKEVI